MDIEAIRVHCLGKEAVEEGFPFGDTTLVFKTGGKIFLLLSLDATPHTFNVKCDPDHAIELREQHPCILPGYHMNKKHWNTVVVDGSLPARELKALIDESYTLVARPPKKKSS